ncbi:amidohydrolase family protein [Streptomyces sp. TRM 70361]|uniref:amidohydrolase family protein n=1 Tax=Streptomyces sp. TRM 70361 TaxID=3116553 RepID=UPI002E7B5955|nr:amidohydrolase family protein [Streptomyces sp. TRM 70361]MEE1941947.1 amidohydrolase family protein [Streptomyces sp. TRM 70361]
MTAGLSRRRVIGAGIGIGAGITAGAVGAPAAHAAAHAVRPGSTVAITGTTVIDATGARPQRNVTVLVRGERIAAVGSARRVRVPADAEVVDGRGKFVVPGFIDSHAHGSGQEEIDPPLFLANGVTTVRDLNGQALLYDWRDRVAAGTLFGPRYLVASSIVDGNPSLLVGLGSPYIEVADGEESRAAVRRSVAEGADFIKVYARLTPDAYHAIADECRKLGVSFVGHTPDAIPLAEASAAGQRSFEHIYTSWFDTSSEEREIRRRLARIEVGGGEYNSWFRQTHPLEVLAARTFDPHRARKVFRGLAADGSHQVPTLTQHRVFDLPESVALHDDRLRYLPAATRDGWRIQLEQLYLAGRSPQDVAEHRELFAARLRWIGAAHRAGVPVLAGTDTGTAYVYPGFSLHDELENLTEAGLSPMQALRAATSAPARFLGLHDVGVVRRGAIADLAVLDADPLADIRNTKRVHAVVVRGALISAERRERMLGDVEAAASAGALPARLAGCACVPVLASADASGLSAWRVRAWCIRSVAGSPDSRPVRTGQAEQGRRLGARVTDGSLLDGVQETRRETAVAVCSNVSVATSSSVSAGCFVAW